MFDFSKLIAIIGENQNLIIAGVLSTIILSVFGTVVGLLIGILIAYGKNWKTRNSSHLFTKIINKIVRTFCQLYSVILRGTPMMVQALIFKYGCAAVGFNWDLIRIPNPAINNVLNGWFLAGLIVITVNTAAYMAEIVQSGLNGIDVGQVEGAKSLGMSNSQTSIKIILPQVIRNSLPTIGNELIVNIKDSSVLNVIATTELYFRIGMISVRTYAYLEGYIILAVIYLLLTLVATGILKLIEKKLDGQKISFNPFSRWKRGLFA